MEAVEFAPLDPFASLLAELTREGAVPLSRLSTKAKNRLAPLLTANVIAEVRAGAGRRLEVRDTETLARFIDRHYPAGLFNAISVDDPQDKRAFALSRFRDTKALGGLDFEIVAYRLAGSQPLRIGDTNQTRSGNPDALGAFALFDRQDAKRTVAFSGVVATVENPTVFMRHDWAAEGVDMAIATNGRMSRRLIAWLASEPMRNARVIHYGDYDPVGLSEYGRLADALGERATLFLPARIEYLFRRYSDRELLTRSASLLPALQKSLNPPVRRVLQLMAEYGGGLEQECILFANTETEQL